MGFEYELLNRMSQDLGVSLEIVVSDDFSDLIPSLNSGKVDLIAHELTVTKERQELVAFTDYIFLTKQMLVQRKPNNWRKMKLHEIDAVLIQDPIELEGDTVSLRAKTSYISRLENLKKEIGGEIYIDTLDGHLTTDDIVDLLVDKKIDYTFLDENKAKVYVSNYPILDANVPVSFSQKIAWATRKNSPELLHALNKWLVGFKKTTDYHVIYNKYFKNKREFRRRVKSDFYSITSNSISKYDDIIKKNANRIGWDWRLIASIIFQESRFDPNAKSWVGAGGLMQIMPSTAKELGITNRHDPAQSILGGTTYLQNLWEKFDSITNEEDRKKFTLAAYNCGYGHVVDAQNLAKKKGLDNTKWDGNVAEALLSLSSRKNYRDPVVKYGYVRGIEPYLYVLQIFERYNHYKEFIEE